MRALGLLVVLVGVVGCGPNERVTWTLDLGETRDTTEWVIVEVHEGGCAAPADVRVVRRGDLAPERNLELPAGVHGFGGRSVDASCRVIGSACRDVRIGSASDFVVVMEPIAAGRCDGPSCPVAECSGATPDAGGAISCETSSVCPTDMVCCMLVCAPSC